MNTIMLLIMYQIFSSLLGHLLFLVQFFLHFYGVTFFGTPNTTWAKPFSGVTDPSYFFPFAAKGNWHRWRVQRICLASSWLALKSMNDWMIECSVWHFFFSLWTNSLQRDKNVNIKDGRQDYDKIDKIKNRVMNTSDKLLSEIKQRNKVKRNAL